MKQRLVIFSYCGTPLFPLEINESGVCTAIIFNIMKMEIITACKTYINTFLYFI